MTITFPVDIPLEEFSEVEVQAVDLNTIQPSTFTGRERVQNFEGDYWKITLRYRNLNVVLGRQVSAFMQSLRGSFGTFVVRFPGYGSSLGQAGTIASSPLVDGGSQNGNRVLNIKNAPVSLQDWLKAGDIIQVGAINRPHWHTVLADVDTDAGGLAVIDVWPAIRVGTSDNDPVVTDEPLGLCRLTEQTRTPIRPPVLYDITINCRESTG